jgi:tricorn protease
MSAQGYYRYPTIRGEQVVFVSEEDLWTVPASGGVARRLTSGLGAALVPALSPDGKWLAFSGRDEGNAEVYVMPAEGGESKRLTFLGVGATVVGWRGDKILFTSGAGQPFGSLSRIYAVSPDGGAPEMLPVGPALTISFGANGGCVIGRNNLDSARWKRYRGGTAGDLWVDTTGKGNFRRLITLKGNLTRPLWISGGAGASPVHSKSKNTGDTPVPPFKGDKIYFLSDHEGVANIYSCAPTGKGLKRHTHHQDYYVRNIATDGARIVYHAGADLFVLDLATDASRKIEISYNSPRTQRNRKFVDSSRYLESYAPHPQGWMLALTSRGKFFTMGNFDGAVLQHGAGDGVRYRLARWLNDGKRLVAVTDAEGEETLEIHHADGSEKPLRLKLKNGGAGVPPVQSSKNERRRDASATNSSFDIGRPLDIKIAPKTDELVLSNHRCELIHVDLKKKTARVLDRSPHSPIAGFDWSPDGKWVAYSCALSLHTSAIKLCKLADGKTFPVTRPVLQDIAPAFDPDGKFLYFLSYREFDPVYDNIHFDLGFPRGVKPYLVTLKKETPSPFVAVPKPPEEKKDEKKDDKKKDDKKKKEEPKTEIDLDGIEDRVLAFPVADGRYSQLAALKGKVLYVSSPIVGSLGLDWYDLSPPKSSLQCFDFESRKSETLIGDINSYALSADRKTMVFHAGGRLRVTKAGEKPTDDAKDPKKSGWIDLNRVKVSVRPPAEWRQMYREAWRLQRDHFWTPDMSQVDWQKIYDRYLPLIERVSTRGEFSDLAWEMQGELATSHCYEMGGDHRAEPYYAIGFLGADFSYDEKIKVWRITRIVRGDPWDDSKTSALAAPGLNVREGDTLLAIGGRKLDANTQPNELLVNLARNEVLVTVGDAKGKHPRTISVKTLAGEGAARYRDWVENNRRIVHERTGGRVGYVHIPNMGPHGYSEFHRYFLAEIDREGLVVDVRFNGGGHVSELILEKLARKRIAYTQSRWFGASPYPGDSVAGPMVAITNEFAGSDGDIFSHNFKQMKLGPLIGKRTWGGVIGIWPRHALVDGGVTTQPEFSFWFKDVGWKVENYGTDPDIEVDFRPQDYVANRDPQLDRALTEIKRLLKKNPPLKPDFTKRPSLALPKLPER